MRYGTARTAARGRLVGLAVIGEQRRSLPLGSATLPELARRGLTVPTYDRSKLRARIAHIGVGGFHRAHLAMYCHELATHGSDWGICGIGLLPADRAMADALRAQDHLYTLTTKRSSVRESEVVGAIIDYVLAADDHEPAVARLADHHTAIISLTITESGYDDTTQNRRTFDVVAHALARRRENNGAGVTVMSCDNLAGNGAAARRCVLNAAGRYGDDLPRWVEANCSFPTSMVDRITPVTSEDDRSHLDDEFGLHDQWPVVAEPYRQWVVEDDFVGGRPDFAAVGALYSNDVHAWELYKLRLLNAGHSAIAYLAALAGLTFVDEALALHSVRRFLGELLHDEAVPTLDPIPGHPREDYVDTVIERFANAGIGDQIARLCIDGTSKFPTFLMPTISAQLELGGPVHRAALALAGWAHYLASVPVERQAHDALGDRSRPLARSALANPYAFIRADVGFPADIVSSDRFRSAFATAHRSIAELGPLGALEAVSAS